jgi:alkanesulfonate monooxygenase SsuD/methylene tetrahydromethanopterin reductase-like flavin-dependent oxidoreductase (luciferase family)
MKGRIKRLRRRAEELGRDPKSTEVAPQFSFTVAKTTEKAERIYMESGLRGAPQVVGLTGRDRSQQVVANLVGSPNLILEKIAYLQSIGSGPLCALMIPANSMSEFIEQTDWFAADVMKHVAV